MSEAASIKDSFNDMSLSKQRSAVLAVSNGVTTVFYDFAQRLVMNTTTGGYYNLTPFSQFDRETLVALRDRLVDLGGNPPELPAEPATALPRQARGLNP
ncbi:MAG TPA: hypothetical protein VEF76_08445 [Patescibacteria group bacterium]|nr:hypothetical protein [Patescibacteria group bacterium]